MEIAAKKQIEHGTAYDMPFGTDAYRKCVIEKYWQLDSDLGIGPANVIGTQGGRDALVKAFQTMLALGYGRIGDAVIVSRVPWISYNWGPYGIGANVMWAPGKPEEGWAYTEESIKECVRFAEKSGRKVAGLVITCPDNPTGLTITPEKQAALAKAALEAGVAYVLFDWMNHFVTDEQPMNLNAFLRLFEPAERERLLILDGITKSLGGSNIRNCHLIANNKFISYIVARASHTVMPSFYSLAVAMTAMKWDMPMNLAPLRTDQRSRKVLKEFLDSIISHISSAKGITLLSMSVNGLKPAAGNTEPLGQYLAEEVELRLYLVLSFHLTEANGYASLMPLRWNAPWAPRSVSWKVLKP